MDDLLKHLEDSVKDVYKNDEFMKDRVNDAWIKMEDYYRKTDDTIAYFAATVLNPVSKYTYFSSHWRTTALNGEFGIRKKKLNELYKTYRNRANEEDSTDSEPADNTGSSHGFWSQHLRPLKKLKDDLTRYLEESVIPEPMGKWHPIDWWLHNKDRVPISSRMAFDILSVPAMAAETERFFSDCKLTVSSQRMKLQATTIEALQLLRSWNRSSVFIHAVLVSSFPLASSIMINIKLLDRSY